jgi:glycine reductase complex component B subunit alpha and beta
VPPASLLQNWLVIAWELATFGSELLDPELELEGVQVEIVRPGDPVRITHILDAVEPRVRPDGRPAFPVEEKAGEGLTNRVKDVVVLSCLDFPAEERPLHEQESVVDMAGPGAELTPFSQTTNVVLSFRTPDGARNEEIEATARRTTLEIAERLAQPTLKAEPVEVERFELGAADDGVPSVAALVQLSDLGPLYYQYVYGVPAGQAGLPRAIDPAELMDGAVTCGEYHWAALRNPTWFFQNNRLVQALYREHGQRLRFAGVVLMRGYEQTAEDKQRAAEEAAGAVRELGADGVVITTDGGGNSHTDVMLTCRACEGAGIRTTVIVAEMADPASTNPGLTDWVPEADCIVSAGNAEEVVPAWEPERLLGGDMSPDPVPVRNYLGATNQMGQLALTATTW